MASRLPTFHRVFRGGKELEDIKLLNADFEAFAKLVTGDTALKSANVESSQPSEFSQFFEMNSYEIQRYQLQSNQFNRYVEVCEAMFERTWTVEYVVSMYLYIANV